MDSEAPVREIEDSGPESVLVVAATVTVFGSGAGRFDRVSPFALTARERRLGPGAWGSLPEFEDWRGEFDADDDCGAEPFFEDSIMLAIVVQC